MVVSQRKSRSSLANDAVLMASTHAAEVQREKLMCCAQYRPADLARLLSSDTFVYGEKDEDDDDAATVTDESDKVPDDVVAKGSLRCWHCTHEFAGDPWHLPVARSGNDFTGVGVFCSPSCAAGWGSARNGYQLSQSISWLRAEARTRSTDGKGDGFAVAPPAHWLTTFGGPLTIEKFRAMGRNGITYIEKAPPFVSRPLVLERKQGSLPPPNLETSTTRTRAARATAAAATEATTTQSRGLYHDYLDNQRKAPVAPAAATLRSQRTAAPTSPRPPLPTPPQHLAGTKRKALPPRPPRPSPQQPPKPPSPPSSPLANKPGTLLGLVRKRSREPAEQK